MDTNVLVHGANRDDPWHAPALAVLERLAAGPQLVHLFWPVLLGFVRIATHPGILPQPLPLALALDNVDALLRLPHVRVHGELDDFWTLARAAQSEARGGNDVPDAHLVALMRQHGVRGIYTRDRGFRRFDGVDVLDVA
jgi:uncharacterized protein